MKILIATLTLVFFVSVAFSQDSTARVAYEKKTIYEYGSRHRLNGKKLSSSELKENLSRFETSKIEYLQSNRNYRTSGYLLLATIVCYVGAFIQIEKQPGLAAGLAITGFSANLIAIPISTKARKHLQKSIWLFNRDTLTL